MSHVDPASNARLADPPVAGVIVHALASDAPDFDMAAAARLLRIVGGDPT
jgi:hypothetical protein